MASDKVFENIKTPVGELMYVNIAGDGAINYDGDGREYKATVKLPKKDGKKFEKEIIKFFNENKPSNYTKDEPVNKIHRVHEDGDWLFNFKTNAVFEKDGVEKKAEIRTFNSKGERKPLPDGLFIGNGSRGLIKGSMSVYTNGKGKSLKAGVSLWLNGIQLSKFVPYTPDDGVEEIDGEFEDFGSADYPTGEDKPKKSKKDKKKKQK